MIKSLSSRQWELVRISMEANWEQHWSKWYANQLPLSEVDELLSKAVFDHERHKFEQPVIEGAAWMLRQVAKRKESEWHSVEKSPAPELTSNNPAAVGGTAVESKSSPQEEQSAKEPSTSKGTSRRARKPSEASQA